MVDKEKIQLAVKMILEAIGEDISREGVKETPSRIANMYEDIFSGLHSDPKEHLKFFTESSSEGEIVFINDIPLYSMCEHHLLPFFGKAHIAYLPKDGKIIGLSKFARIVECFSKRPQVQERLTSQIADFLFDELDAQGLAVMIEAEHLCMTMRGAKSFGSKTVTFSFKGLFKENDEYKSRLMNLFSCRG